MEVVALEPDKTIDRTKNTELMQILATLKTLQKQITRIDIRCKNIEETIESHQLPSNKFDSDLSKLNEFELPVESVEQMKHLEEKLEDDELHLKLVCHQMNIDYIIRHTQFIRLLF